MPTDPFSNPDASRVAPQPKFIVACPSLPCLIENVGRLFSRSSAESADSPFLAYRGSAPPLIAQSIFRMTRPLCLPDGGLFDFSCKYPQRPLEGFFACPTLCLTEFSDGVCPLCFPLFHAFHGHALSVLVTGCTVAPGYLGRPVSNTPTFTIPVSPRPFPPRHLLTTPRSARLCLVKTSPHGTMPSQFD